ncbi:unnamed protein product [Pedinophyceae sp. YPF-701]|nr:unnamed protein product [Pedinophyceae sp. YPF-701]
MTFARAQNGAHERGGSRGVGHSPMSVGTPGPPSGEWAAAGSTHGVLMHYAEAAPPAMLAFAPHVAPQQVYPDNSFFIGEGDQMHRANGVVPPQGPPVDVPQVPQMFLPGAHVVHAVSVQQQPQQNAHQRHPQHPQQRLMAVPLNPSGAQAAHAGFAAPLHSAASVPGASWDVSAQLVAAGAAQGSAPDLHSTHAHAHSLARPLSPLLHQDGHGNAQQYSAHGQQATQGFSGHGPQASQGSSAPPAYNNHAAQLQARSGPPPAQDSSFGNSTSILAHAHTAYRSGHYQRALELCQTVHTREPLRTDVLLLLGAVYYQLGRLSECITCNDRCIMLDPTLAEAYANLANALQQQGSTDLAILYYQNAIRLRPGFTDAYNNLASALIQKGLVANAMECYNEALRRNPALSNVRVNLGDLWRSQGAAGHHPAQQCYSEALTQDPKCAAAWRGLGDLMREMGQVGSAVPYYRAALQHDPMMAEAYTELGRCLKELGQTSGAEQCYQEACRVQPNSALALGNLAGLYYESGKLDMAAQTYQSAIKIEPNFPEAYNNLGNALRELGRANEAIACYTACIQLQYARSQRPGSDTSPAHMAACVARLTVAYNNLGGLLKAQGRMHEAICCYERVVTLQPTSPESHANLGAAYKDSTRHEEAIVSYRNSLQLRHDFPEAFANMVHSLQCICDWTDRPQLFARLEAEIRRDLSNGALPPVQPFHAMAYPLPADLPLKIAQAYARLCAANAALLKCPPLAHPEAKPLARGERLRVAYVSSDFGNHPLSHLMGSVFGLHDRTRLEVFCYALSPPDGSPWRQRIEREAEHFIDVSAWSVQDIAQRISADGIHVGVNLNGYTKGSRNEIFALRPAPVQCSYMGFPATAGADFLPYLIVDKVVAPKELHHCYTEKIVQMPNCYFVNDYKQSHMDVLDEANVPSRESQGLPADKVIYACSNQLYKYDPDTFRCWCNILRRVPNSVLWLLRFPPAGEPRVKAEAARQGVDPARIIFTDVAQKDLHIRRSGLADVFLDTPLCNAHTTGCDVLWSGCPMVTLPLERMASRVAASLCVAIGCPELVVRSHAEYEELAVDLGTNTARRLALRERIKQSRLSCPLFDTKGWVRDFERVFFKMWDIHCQGKEPHAFELPPEP